MRARGKVEPKHRDHMDLFYYYLQKLLIIIKNNISIVPFYKNKNKNSQTVLFVVLVPFLGSL